MPSSDFDPLVSRITNVETRMTNVEQALTQVQEDTFAIRTAIVGATHLGTFIKKHGGKIAGFTVGSLMTSGCFSFETLQRLHVAVSYMMH